MALFSSTGRKAVLAYKYSCVDSSPLSKYVMHPFWNHVVKLCPKTIAPNTLTFLGFILTVLHYIILTYYNPTMLTPLDTSFVAYFCCGFLVFFAHTLDGIDGKQARITSSSSALGELFDHGCDAWVAVLLPCSVMSILGENMSSINMFHIQALGSIGFVFSHWEKYITGVLYLPWLFDLSQLMFFILFLLASNLSINAILTSKFMVHIIVMFIIGSFWIVHMPISAIRCLFQTKKRKNMHNWHYISPLFDTLLTTLLIYIWILRLGGNELLNKNPRLFLLSYGTTIANVAIRVMVAELGKMEIKILSSTVILQISLVLLDCFLRNFTSVFQLMPSLDIYLLASICLFIIIIHVRYSVQLVNELCEILNIKAFTITK